MLNPRNLFVAHTSIIRSNRPSSCTHLLIFFITLEGSVQYSFMIKKYILFLNNHLPTQSQYSCLKLHIIDIEISIEKREV